MSENVNTGADAMIKSIVDTVRAAGLTAYLPGQHQGECREPYVIVSDGGTRATGKTTGEHVYLVTAIVPIGMPLRLHTLMADVMTAMKSLTMLTQGGTSEEDIDEEVMCRFKSVEYGGLCSLI